MQVRRTHNTENVKSIDNSHGRESLNPCKNFVRHEKTQIYFCLLWFLTRLQVVFLSAPLVQDEHCCADILLSMHARHCYVFLPACSGSSPPDVTSAEKNTMQTHSDITKNSPRWKLPTQYETGQPIPNLNLKGPTDRPINTLGPVSSLDPALHISSADIVLMETQWTGCDLMARRSILTIEHTDDETPLQW